MDGVEKGPGLDTGLGQLGLELVVDGELVLLVDRLQLQVQLDPVAVVGQNLHNGGGGGEGRLPCGVTLPDDCVTREQLAALSVSHGFDLGVPWPQGQPPAPTHPWVLL